MSATTPTQKLKLLNTDLRLPVLAQGLDDRKEDERKAGGIQEGRGAPINYYISDDKRCMNMYNDRRYTINKKVKKMMLKKNKELKLGLDKKLMNHFAYLMVRDNICMFEDDFEEEKVKNKTNHFEAYQSTSWNDIRFKPPPTFDSKIGWRVEFRPVEAQIMPEQNFLFSHAVVVFHRLIICEKMRVNFYIPMSLVKIYFLKFKGT